MPRPVSSRHAPMTIWNRAAQFAPFAALTGLDGEMAEAGRLTDRDTVLTEERVAELDGILRQAIAENREVTVTFFVPDGKKTGGSFQTATGYIKKVVPMEGLVLQNGLRIALRSIRSLKLIADHEL